MLPEYGILLTYILKQSQKDSKIKVVDSPTRPETKAADYVVDILMSSDNHKISENSQKLHGMKKLVEDIAVILSMSQPVMEDKEIMEEELMESQPVMMTMVDKLAKDVNYLGSEIRKEESLKTPAVDLMLQIQSALDECNLFPENTTVDILDIINMIPDKSVVAWKEKLNSEMEIDSHEAKTLACSVAKESHMEDQERKQEAKDVYITQKCAKILQNASRTYEFAVKTAAGLADLVGMCDGGKDFKDMMNIVVSLPSMIQQQAEAKIKEVEERKAKVQDRMELVSIKNLDHLMIATILPKFKEEWEDPQFEATNYLAAIFKFWLRRAMFPGRKPDVHNIAVKFRCSHTELQKYLEGYHKPPSVQQLMIQ